MAMKVLVATDGSEHGMKAVQRGMELAEKEGADVTLMTVAYYSKDYFDEIPLGVQEKLESHALDVLEKAKTMFEDRGLKVMTVMEAGLVPANNIIRRAEEGKFEQVIMGSTGVSGFKRFLIGSTAAKVVANAPCCVTIIR